jgi:hypothetical protein
MRPTICIRRYVWPAFMMALLPTIARAEIEYVIAISVDGLRGDYLRTFIESTPTDFPNFVRLRNQSAYTYNARCDYSHSITVPSHIGMLTSRPVLQPDGMPNTVHHGYASDFPGATETIHLNGNPAVPYKASIFDVTHDRGLTTAFYASKDRLTICDRSYNATNGAPDVVGPDNGKDKINFTQIIERGSPTLRSTLVSHISGTLEKFTFFHIAETDYAGHSGGWSTTVGSEYRNAVRTADGHIGAILDAIEARQSLNGKVAIVLTADHGGGGSTPTSHLESSFFGNYNIPLFVSAPGFAGGTDLYRWFSNRVPPDDSRPDYAAPGQPLRNTDVGNLSAALLGLPSIPGSLSNPELIKPVTVERTGSDFTVRWPAYLTGYELESTSQFTPPNWQKVSSGISQAGESFVYSFTAAPAVTEQFFRLRLKPDQPPNANARLLPIERPQSMTKPAIKKRRYRLLPDGSLELLR